MMVELGNHDYLSWFQQAYNKYVDGQRFAPAIPGTRKNSGLTLGNDTNPLNSVNLRGKIFMTR